MITEKIKQIEREIEKIEKSVIGSPFEDEPEEAEPEYLTLKAKLSAYKECQAEEKRKVDELKKWIDNNTPFREILKQEIKKIFSEGK